MGFMLLTGSAKAGVATEFATESATMCEFFGGKVKGGLAAASRGEVAGQSLARASRWGSTETGPVAAQTCANHNAKPPGLYGVPKVFALGSAP